MAEIPTAVEAELARLRAENTRLLRLLKLTPQQAAPLGPAQAAYFEAHPGLVDDGSPPEAKVAFYAALFAARTDVYATRFDNPRTGKGGWVPAVRGGWRKGTQHVRGGEQAWHQLIGGKRGGCHKGSIGEGDAQQFGLCAVGFDQLPGGGNWIGSRRDRSRMCCPRRRTSRQRILPV